MYLGRTVKTLTIMPAKSEAQRRLLNAKFGHKWVKKHHFDNKGKLPEYKHEALTARAMFERDDAPKLGLGKTGLKFARMNSKEAFKTTDGTDEKWKTSLKLRAGLAGEKPSAKMQSRDAVGKVPRAMKGLGERITAEQVVAKLLA